jgi:hypothetical protein
MSLFFKLHISAINVAFVNYQAKENLPEQRGQAAKVLTSLKMPEPRVQVPAAPQAKENFPEQRGPVAKSNSFCNTTLKTKQPQFPRK